MLIELGGRCLIENETPIQIVSITTRSIKYLPSQQFAAGLHAGSPFLPPASPDGDRKLNSKMMEARRGEAGALGWGPAAVSANPLRAA